MGLGEWSLKQYRRDLRYIAHVLNNDFGVSFFGDHTETAMENFDSFAQARVCLDCGMTPPASAPHRVENVTPDLQIVVCPNCWMHSGDCIQLSLLQKFQRLLQLYEWTHPDLLEIIPDEENYQAFIRGDQAVLNDPNAETLADAFGVGFDLFGSCS